MAMDIRQMTTDAAQVDKPVNGSQLLIHGDVILQQERVKQRWLRLLPRPHHRQFSPRLRELNHQFSS